MTCMCLHTCVYKHIDIQSRTQGFTWIFVPYQSSCYCRSLLDVLQRSRATDDFKAADFHASFVTLKTPKVELLIQEDAYSRDLLGQSQPSIMLRVIGRYEYSVRNMDDNNCR